MKFPFDRTGVGQSGRSGKTALVAGAVVASLFLAACGGPANGGSASSSKIPAGTFIDLVGSIPATMDEHGPVLQAREYEVPNWTATLVRNAGDSIDASTLSSAGNVQPFLADSFTQADNGSITFKLPDNLLSQDGNKLTADDVKYSFERAVAIGPAISSGLAQVNVDTANPITVVDKNTVVLNATVKTSALLGYLTKVDFGILDSVVMKAHSTPDDKWGAKYLEQHSASFAPYYVGAVQPSEQITLKRNPNWNKSNVHFDTVIMRVVPDAGSRLQLVMNGEASHTTGLSWQQFDTAVSGGAARGVKAVTAATTQTQFLMVNGKIPPTDQQTVRRAVSYALDRSTINNTIFLGKATPSTRAISAALPLPAGTETLSYDPEKAKQLLAAAGLTDKATLNIVAAATTGGAGIQAELELIQQELGAVGIKTTVDVKATDSEVAASVDAFPQSTVSNTSPLIADPLWTWQGYWRNENPYAYTNIFGLKDPQLQSDLVASATAPEGPVRDQLTTAIHNRLIDNANMIPIVDVPAQHVFSTSITGFQALPQPIVYYDRLSQ